ncbi:MAG: hypothetical protein AAF657_13525 [Acidobacteriota bacterium]
MLQRFSIARSILVVLVLGTLLPAAAVPASLSEPMSETLLLAWMTPDAAAPSLAVPTPKLSCGYSADAIFEPAPFRASCTDQCRALYFSCLDDCDAAPFPGCYNFCRFDVLYPCYKSCF